MIDYSVYLTGNPMDEMAPEKAYARAQMSESMTFDKFVKHIADHNGVYTRGTDFDGLIERAQFNPVASRTAQAATLKAEKEGLSTVDLEAAKG